jgi:hypothetical protein
VRPGRHAADDGSMARSTGMAAGRGALLLLVAVVIGIVLLNKADNTGTTTVSQTNTTAKPGKATTTTTPPSTTTTTLAAHDPASVKVQPVNGTNTGGVAARAKDALLAAHYNALAPADAKNKPVKITVVFFAPGYEGDARLIATLLHVTSPNIQPMPAVRTNISSNPANADAANVILVVGEDIANSLPAATTTTTAKAATTTTTAAKSSTTTTAKAATTTTTTKKP